MKGIRLGLALLVLSTVVCAQEIKPSVVSEDEAKSHLIEYKAPVYPPLAKAARIQGKVRIEFVVDESGRVKDRKLISGHPMLAPAAIEAVSSWKYKPFLVDGKPAAVRTVAEVYFDLHVPEADLKRDDFYQKNYFHNYDEAVQSLRKGDVETAETKAKLALEASEQVGDSTWLSTASCLSLLGHIAVRQGKISEAAAFYKRSLSLHKQHQKPDEAEVGGSLLDLGLLYFGQKDFESAEPLITRAKEIYEKRVSELEPDKMMPEAKNHYGRQIALGSYLLANIAASRKDLARTREYCHKAVEFAMQYSISPEKESIITNCAPALK